MNKQTKISHAANISSPTRDSFIKVNNERNFIERTTHVGFFRCAKCTPGHMIDNVLVLFFCLTETIIQNYKCVSVERKKAVLQELNILFNYSSSPKGR